MDIREVYNKFYYQDLKDEFDYPEANEGYNEALDQVVSMVNDNESVEYIRDILSDIRIEMARRHNYDNQAQKYRYLCGWDYVKQNLRTAMKISIENIENPIFRDFGTGIYRYHQKA